MELVFRSKDIEIKDLTLFVEGTENMQEVFVSEVRSENIGSWEELGVNFQVGQLAIQEAINIADKIDVSLLLYYSNSKVKELHVAE